MRPAKILSYLFHPILVPLYTLLIVLNLDFYTAVFMPLRSKISIAVMVSITTLILPLMAMLVLKRSGFITSLQMEERRERTIPFIITAAFYYIAFHSLNSLSLPSLIPLLLFGGTLAVLFTMLINFFWKISAHMVGAGGICGLFAGLSLLYGIDLLPLIIMLVILSGLTAWSRLKSESHSPAQIYAGYALGLITMIGLLLYTR
jgi:hypothetical protein